MELKQIQDEVEIALDEIYAMRNSRRFRCHEVARLLKRKLNEFENKKYNY